jgi:hypothetical protein
MTGKVYEPIVETQKVFLLKNKPGFVHVITEKASLVLKAVPGCVFRRT